LLGGVLAFLTSLYLPWTTFEGSQAGFFDSTVNGWGLFGQPAGLIALGLAAATAASLVRPRLGGGLPLGAGAFALAFFATMSAAQLWEFALYEGAFDRVAVHLGSGAYLGLTSAGAAFFGTAWLRRSDFGRPSATAVAGTAFTLAILAALLVPPLNVHAPHVARGAATGYQLSFTDTLPPMFISGLACFGLPLWTRPGGADARLAVTTGIAVLTGGYLSSFPRAHWAWESWLLLGSSLALVGLAVASLRELKIGRPAVAEVATVGAGVILIGALFLPWGKECPRGTCPAVTGWSSPDSAMAGGLAVLLLVFLLGFRRFLEELAGGVAVYVMAAGCGITLFGRLEYGAPLGFAGAALLLLSAGRRVGLDLDPNRPLARVVPPLACAAFLAIPIASLTQRLSVQHQLESPWRIFFVGAAAILLAIRLLVRWLRRPRDRGEVVALPFLMLALTALDLIYERNDISWEGWASVVLCAALVALGWVERSGGLERLRVPDEIWRVDRLPG
jgi:hypothetical protein